MARARFRARYFWICANSFALRAPHREYGLVEPWMPKGTEGILLVMNFATFSKGVMNRCGGCLYKNGSLLKVEQ